MTLGHLDNPESSCFLMILNDWGKVLLPFTGWGTRKWNLRILIQAVTNDFLRHGVFLGDGVPSHVSVTLTVQSEERTKFGDTPRILI